MLMQIDAIYDQGRLEFISPVRLKSGRIGVQLVVPDEKVEQVPSTDAKSYELPDELKQQSRKTLNRLAEIRNAPLPDENELPELTEKQQQRIEAFALREEIKGTRN